MALWAGISDPRPLKSAGDLRPLGQRRHPEYAVLNTPPPSMMHNLHIYFNYNHNYQHKSDVLTVTSVHPLSLLSTRRAVVCLCMKWVPAVSWYQS